MDSAVIPPLSFGADPLARLRHRLSRLAGALLLGAALAAPGAWAEDIELERSYEGSVNVQEGFSSGFTLWLKSQPDSDIDLTLTLTGSEDVSVNPISLEFTTSNWDTAQIVTVSAKGDNDNTDDETATLTISGTGVVTMVVPIAVEDDDIALVVSESSLTMAESGSQTFTVRLAEQLGLGYRSRKVTLAVTGQDSGDIKVSPSSLTFTRDDSLTNRTVTVRAEQDDDPIDDTATINLTGPSIVSSSVSVTVDDDDDAHVGVTTSDLEQLSEGGSKTFTVQLASQPGNARRVELAVAGNSDVTVAPNRLDFTRSSWNTAQVVTVRAAHDTDQTDDDATINLTGNGITAGAVSVSVHDDDDADVRLTLTALETLTEGGSKTFTVKLASRPSNARQVELAAGGDDDVTVSPASLNFTTSNWNTAQSVTVSAADDDDKADDAATVRLSGRRITSASVNVKVDDDDDGPVGLTLSDLERLAEGGSKTFTVRLASLPGNARRVELAVDDNADVTVSPTSLDFTTSNWDTAQTVTVRAGQDADESDDTATISLTGDGITAGSVSASVEDDDDADVGLALSALDTLTEGGSQTFTVQLAARPVNARRVALTVTGNDEVTVAPEALDFTPSNWNVAQTVTVRAQDDVDQSDDTASISLTGRRITSGAVSVTVSDISVGLELSALEELTEGGSKTFTVKLAERPGSARKVTLTVSGDDDVTVNPASLDFTATDWSTAQTVTVSASQDDDKTDDAATINLAVDGIASGTLAVAVDDDDDAAVGLKLSDLERVPEGGSRSFTVQLAAQPGNARRIMLAITGDADVSFSPASLDFTPAGWDSAQTVTVRAGFDADLLNDTATISLTGDGITAASVSVTVDDDDDAVVGLALSALEQLTEGGSRTFTVRLTAQPGNARKVALTVTGDDDVTVAPQVLDFTTSNWSTVQTVTVSAAQDTDLVDDTATISLTGDGITAASVSVRVSDTSVGLALSALAGLIEGGSQTFTVALAALPDGARKVTLTVDGDASVTVAPTELDFTADNWNTARTVTVSAAGDADKADDTATISLAVDGALSGSVDVTVEDDDDVDVGLELSALDTLTEGGSKTFTVQLAAQPGNARRVALAVTGDAGVTVSPASLDFTPDSWSAAQTVTVSAGQDADKADGSATISLTGDGISAGSVDVKVEDDDDVDVGLELSALDTLPEGGSKTFTVRLAVQPGNDRQIALLLNGDADVTLSPTSLDFTPSNWSTARTVTVSAKDDADKTDDTATIDLLGDGVTSAAVSVRVDDDDDADVGLVLSDLDILTEGGSDTFTVALASQPGNLRTVKLEVTDNADVTIDRSSLDFYPSNWNTPLTVRVQSAEDDDKVDDTATVSLSGDGITFGSVDVRVDDDDDVDVLLTLSTLATLTEGGSQTFTVQLGARPSNARKVALAVTGDSDVTVSPPSLDFTPSNWNTAQTVTVSAAQDADQRDDTATVNLSGDGVFNNSVSVTVDDISIGLVLSTQHLRPTEGGSGTFKVRLNERPDSARKVTLTVDGDGDVTVAPSELDFTTTDWNKDQTVTVSAAADTDQVDDRANVNLAVDGILSGSVPVTVDDDDDADVSLTLSDLDNLDDLVEDSSQTFKVQLAAQPSNARIILLSVTGDSDVSVNPRVMPFSASNWNTAQTVTVSARADDDRVDDTATINLTGDGITGGTVSVPVTADDNDDNDVGLTLSALDELAEGGSQTFTVALAVQPGNARTVALAVTGDDDVTVSTASLNFTAAEWNTAQTVTVSSKQDADKADDTATISLTGDGITAGSVSVTVDDDEDSAVGLVLSDLDELTEGGSKTFTVQLASLPGNARKVALAVTGNNDVTVAPEELDFTTSNWDTAQTVTVRAGQDDDQADDSATINLTGDGITAGSVSVSVSDDEDAAVALTLSDLDNLDDLTEGGSQTFTVQLAAQPGNAREVALTVSGSDDVTVAPDVLNFSTTDWNMAQTVTVRAKQDVDRDDDTATIALTGDGITSGSVSVTVDDESVFLVLPSVLSVNEGSSAPLRVKLHDQPAGDLKVTLAVDGDADVTTTKDELDFTRDNWNVDQTVTVNAAQDDDLTDDTATISLAVGGILSGLVRVTAFDDDDTDVALTLSDLDELDDLVEGGSKAFKVQLAAQPANGLSITLGVDGDADVTVDPTHLIFLTSGWDTAQTVTVSAMEDADKADDTATISINGHGITASSVDVTVDDNDDGAVGLVLSDLETLAEGGSKTFTVKLAVQPGNARKVTLAVTGDSDVTVTPKVLDFTTANWNMAQTVTVRAAQDADQADDTATVSLTGDGITAGSVDVSVNDDDDAAVGLALSALETLAEGGSKTFTVALAAQPGNARKVALAVAGDSDVTVAPGELNFTTANWNTAQTVTVSAAQDTDQTDDTATVNLTGDGITAGAVSVTVSDDEDSAVGLALSDLDEVTEGGSKTFTVELAVQPVNARRVVLAVAGNDDVTVAPDVLNFTTSGWDTAQTVTVRAAHDPDQDDDTATINLTGDRITSGSVSVSVDDDDDADSGLALSALETLAEGGSKTFTVRLSTQPGNARSVALAVTGDNNVTISPTSLNFSTTNWNTAQTVTVSAEQDDDQADDTATIALTGDSITTASVSVTVDDDDDVDVGLELSDLDDLTEGGSKTFSVALAALPGNPRTVALAVSGNSDVTVMPKVLNFTLSNWDTAQTVTVNAGHDDDKSDDTATINLTGDGITAGSVSVSVADDDDVDVGLTLSVLETLAEGGSKTFTVALAAQPGNARKVELALTGDGDVSITPNELNFTAASWSTAQTVTVSSVQDADQIDDTATIALTGDGITAGSVSVTVDDDEDADVGLVLSDLDPLTEGGSKTFTVALAAQPGNPRRVVLAVTGDSDVTVAPEELDFSTTNWNMAQTVTVSAGDDTDQADDTATVSLTGHGITAGSVDVTVDDDDDGAVGLTLSDLETLAEGGSKTFSVALAAQPGNARRVTLAASGDDDVTVSPTSLDFTTANWNTAQTVTVSAGDDTDQADDTATIALTGDGITADSVSVTVDDDDDADVGLELSDLDGLTEGGSKTFTVALAAQPGNARKVELAVTGDSDVTVAPEELNFSTTDWSAAQTVTVSAADDTDQTDDTATVNLTGDGITAGSVSVTVDDDDDVDVGLTLSALETLAEGGSKTFTVALAAQPANARSVALAVTGDDDVTVSPEELDFTTANWSTAQTVTVSAEQDTDQADDSATVNLTGDGITAGAVSVSVDDDDDSSVGLTLSDLDTLAEGGSKTFTVKLTSQPGNARSVALAVTGDADVTVSPASLDFSTTDWSTAKTVTVSAGQDTDMIDDTASIALTGAGITASSVSVSVEDDDDAAVGLELSDLETLTEGAGGSKTFSVELAAQPANARRVALAVTDNADVTVSPEELDFTTSNWDTAQTVTVRAADDADKADDSATISLTGGRITAGSVSVTVDDDDDDDVGLTLSALENLAEGGSKTFTVELAAQPGNARRVMLAVSGDDDVTVAPEELDFSTTDWDTAQTVTVSADQDTDQADDTATIALTGDGITAGSVSVTVDDDDDVDVGLTLSALETLTEGAGGSKTFTVQLAAQPGNARRVALAVTGDSDVTVSPASLDFSTTDWSTAQTVTVSAGDDADKADDSATIALTGDGITAGSVSVTVDDDDDDDVGLTLSALEPLAEGGSKTFTVNLAALPGNPRRVTLAVDGDDDVTVAPEELDFTTTDWNITQTVTVSARQDADQADDSATINLTGDGITAGAVSVTVDDDDDSDVGLVLSALENLTEGGSKTFTVKLTAQPGNAREVALAVSGDSDVTVSPTSLDFTTADWSAAQTVTVSAGDDADQIDDTATVSLSGDGITAGAVSVRVDDDDDDGVGLTLSDLDELAEGASETFTVQLAVQPVNARRVALAVTGDADVTVTPSALDFTSSNWNVPQTVTVSAGQDDDPIDDTATISLTGSRITAGAVSVSVNDDDDGSVGLVLSALEQLAEGGSNTFTVKLAGQPGNAREVALAVSGDSDVTVSPASLDFTADNWSAEQTVTVSAGQDTDKADDSAIISLTGEGITTGSVSVTVDDDEDADVGLVLSDLEELTEGGSETFTVKLAVQPGNARRITLAVTGDADVTISPASLDFTTTSWSTAQVVTVSAAPDADQTHDTATVSLTGDGITAGSVSVTVRDDEDADVGLALSALETLAEAGSKTFTVKLAAQPANARKVALTVAGDSDVTVSPASLDFTRDNWSAEQTVTVSAAADADKADDSATINLTGEGITAGAVAVTVDDDDDADVGLALSDLSPLTEGGSETFTVRLTAPPGNARRITLTVTGDADVTVSPASLDFTADNWSTAQVVTVSAEHDVDETHDTATISLTGDRVTAGAVDVKVMVHDDEDDAVGLELSDLEPLTEGGSKTFTVRLAVLPSNDRRVALAVIGDADVTVSPASLDFTTSNWNTVQTVTVSARADADQVDDDATIVLTGTGITSGSVWVTVDDDDDGAVGLALSDLDTLAEGGTKTFTVELAAQPANARRVALTVTGDADVTVTPNELDFTPSNWDTAQTVTVRAGQDDDQNNDSATVSLTGHGITAGAVAVTVDDDDDDAVGLALSDLDAVPEGGSETFTVRLAAQPGNARRVALTVTDNTEVTVVPSALDFTAGNWSTAQTVTVSARQDAGKTDDSATISLTGNGITAGSVAVTVEDDEDAAVGLTLSDLETLAEGGSKTFSVQLAGQPANPRKVALAVTGDADVTVTPEELDFTAANWSTAQMVTVSAEQDDDQADDSATIALTGGRITAGAVTVTVDDDEDTDVGLALSDLEPLTEGGSKTFTVRLAAQPGNARKVALTVDGDADVTVTPEELDFTAVDWNTAQTVTVSAADDADQTDDSATINLTGDGITAGAVSVTVDDDDDADVGLTLSELEPLAEGGSKTFTVRLAVQPGNARKVALTVAGNADVTVAPEELDFTRDNWSAAQTVTVSAAADIDKADDSATINLTGDGITAGAVSVTVADDDDADVGLALSDLETLAEGGSKTFTVRLAAQPGNARNVALAVAGDADVTVTPASLDFTADNWSTAQTVTVSAEDDDDKTDDSATINLTGDGITAGAVAVTVADNDDADVGLALSALETLAEGGSKTFTVRLAAQPGNARRVALTVADNPDVTVIPTSLDFTTTDWNTAQTVTVSAGQDADETDDTATINLTGDGILPGSVAVSVTDDDADQLPAEEEIVVKLQLAEIAGSLLSSTSDVIKLRLDAPRGARSAVVAGQQIALDRSLMSDIAAGFASRAGAQEAALQPRFASGRFGAERQSSDWLGGITLEEGRPVRTEVRSAGGAGGAAALLSSFSYALGPNTEGGAGWSVWGRFDTRDFSGSTADSAEFDGSQSGFWLGFDSNTNRRVAFGLAFGSASADSAYALGSVRGSVDTTMTTLLPYLEFNSGDGSTARVILGRGSGEVTLTQPGQGRLSADMSMELMAISGNWPLARRGNSTLLWTGDLGISTLKPDTGREPNALDGLDVTNTRFRSGIELEHSGLGSAWKTAPRFGLSFRHDGGDGLTGTGMELNAGLQMRSPEERFSLDISLRTLGMHSAEDMTDTSASVEFRLNSRPNGEGMSFALGPYWGAAEADLLERDEAFRLDQADLSQRRQRQQERGVAARLAYGLRGLGGMLVPYSEYDFTSGEYGSMRQVAGVKFSRPDTLELRLFSERQASGRGAMRSRLRVELQRLF